MVLELLQWAETTALSVSVRESVWAYPIIESTHVLSLCLFLGLTALMDIRLIGAGLRNVPVDQITSRVLPLIRWGFLVISVSGALLFWATPVTFYGNVFFRAKVVLLLLAGANAWWFHATIHKSVGEWGREGVTPPPRARFAGFASITLWLAVVATGRFIAYNWFN